MNNAMSKCVDRKTEDEKDLEEGVFSSLIQFFYIQLAHFSLRSKCALLKGSSLTDTEINAGPPSRGTPCILRKPDLKFKFFGKGGRRLFLSLTERAEICGLSERPVRFAPAKCRREIAAMAGHDRRRRRGLLRKTMMEMMGDDEERVKNNDARAFNAHTLINADEEKEEGEDEVPRPGRLREPGVKSILQ
jgi:hypothetical protein